MVRDDVAEAPVVAGRVDKGGFLARGLPLTEEQLKGYKNEDDRGEKSGLNELGKNLTIRFNTPVALRG